MYNLYVDVYELELRLTKERGDKPKFPVEYLDEPKQYNSNYFVCAKREPLRELACSIHAQWVKDAEARMSKLRDMKF